MGSLFPFLAQASHRPRTQKRAKITDKKVSEKLIIYFNLQSYKIIPNSYSSRYPPWIKNGILSVFSFQKSLIKLCQVDREFVKFCVKFKGDP